MAARTSSSAGRVFALPLEAWVEHTLSLLEQEREAELLDAYGTLTTKSASELEASGIALLKLAVTEVTSGLFGRSVVVLADRFARPLPAHRFTVGDIIGLRLHGSNKTGPAAAVVASDSGSAAVSIRALYDASGVVTSVADRTISVALEDAQRGTAAPSSSSANSAGDLGPVELGVGDAVRIDRLADDVSFKRVSGALRDLKDYRHGPASRLLRVLFSCGGGAGAEQPQFGATGQRAPLAAEIARALADDSVVYTGDSDARAGDSNGMGEPFTPFNRALNGGQRAAIAACLSARDLSMIHGPPGTGKTTAVVEYIRQEVARGRRVLACAPSNVAVDNIVERLATAGGTRIVRLGHPARVSESLQRHSLDAQVRSAEGTGIVSDVRKELGEVQRQARATRNKEERRALRGEERRLRAEIRTREERIVFGVVRSADVVLCTVTGAATKVLRRALTIAQPGDTAAGGDAGSVFRGFDVTVIDEVAQAVEASCYIPALLSPKLVVAGDHCQLPPTVLSEDAARKGLALTLADRIVARFGDDSAAGGSGSDEGLVGSVGTSASVADAKPPRVVHMLREQYRMHAHISDWASHELYHDRLAPHPSVAAHTLRDLPHVATALAALASEHASESDSVGVDGDATELVVRIPTARLEAVHAAAAEAGRQKQDDAKAAASAPPPAASGRGRAVGKPGAVSSNPDRDGLVASLTEQAAALTLGASAGSPDEPCLEMDVGALTSPMLLIDTAGCDCEEAGEAGGGDSKANVGEAGVIVKHVLALAALGVRTHEMAVVTPYNAQVALLRALLAPSFPGLEVKSVDSFQGQEREAILLSLVRSNTAREVGFLADHRRLNVAVTRARRHVAVVCDSDTVTSDPFIARLVEHITAVGEVRSAAEYAGAGGVAGMVREADLACFETPGTKPALAVKGKQNTGKDATDKAASAAGIAAASDPDGKRRYVALSAQINAFVAAAATAGARASKPFSIIDSSAAAGDPLALPPAKAHLAPDLPQPARRLEFAPSLSSYERMLIHVAASAAGLRHGSVGEGRARRAVVYAPATSDASKPGSDGAAEGAGRVPAGYLQHELPPVPLPAENAWAALSVASEDGDDADEEHASDVPSAVPPPALSAPPAPDSAQAPSIPTASEPRTVSTAAAASPVPVAPGRKPVVTSGKLGSSTAAGTAAAQPSLAAQLAAERRARAAAATGAGSKPASRADDGLPSLFGPTEPAPAKPAGNKLGKGGASKLPPTSAGSKGSGSGGAPATEFGLPVGKLKPLPGAPSADGSAASKKPSSKKGGKGGGAASLAAADEDDEWALLNALASNSNKCGLAGCKKTTDVVGCMCSHCRYRFCYEHGLPEVHGCGDAVRAAARGAWLGGGGMAAATGAPPAASTQLKGWQRDAVSNKLQKKLDEAATGRATKAPEKKGKK